MTFHREELSPPHHPKLRKYMPSSLKDAFSNCRTCNGRKTVSILGPEDDCITTSFDDEQEVVISLIRRGAKEKLEQKPRVVTDIFSQVFYSRMGEVYIKQEKVNQKDDDETQGSEDFFSVGSCLSECSSGLSRQCSSLDIVDGHERRQSILEEFCQCEGWPFGLCRKAALLPPLPKSPSESWRWHKRNQIANTLYI